MTAITIEDVKKLARLSALSVSDTEAETMGKELTAIIEYVEQLSNVDTTGLEPTYQVNGLVNVTRKDEIREYGVSQAALLKNAPDTQNGQIKVKKVL